MIDLTGQKFGKLTVLETAGIYRDGSFKWLCLCDCGNKCVGNTWRLRKGLTLHCGCETTRKKNKHGLFGTRFYRIYHGIKYRVLNPRGKDFDYYNSLGMCDRWLLFENFRDDMYESYLKHVEEFGEKDTQIDRKKNNLGYCPENCRWATLSIQSLNRTNRFPRRKLTDLEVVEIRNSDLGKQELSKRFSVTTKTIQNIKAKRTWKHL